MPRFRNFSLVTYLDEIQIQCVLEQHQKQLKAYAYIKHDRDIDKIPHYHLLIALYNNTTENAIKNWFFGFKDINDKDINTFVQPLQDVKNGYLYLTHDTKQCEIDNKVKYNADDIVSYNDNFFKSSALQDIDNLTMALNDMLCDVPLYEIAQKYGRDFIVHYGHLKMLLNDIKDSKKI